MPGECRALYPNFYPKYPKSETFVAQPASAATLQTLCRCRLRRSCVVLTLAKMGYNGAFMMQR
jgi:hypothetical protein